MKNIIVLFVLLATSISFSLPPEEQSKIDYLLKQIEKSEAIFIRNGKEHPSEAAVKHLKMKLDSAKNSWFAPDESKWTAIMFIEKIASKSSMSGKPYLIKVKDKKVKAKDWLMNKLKQYNE